MTKDATPYCLELSLEAEAKVCDLFGMQFTGHFIFFLLSPSIFETSNDTSPAPPLKRIVDDGINQVPTNGAKVGACSCRPCR